MDDPRIERWLRENAGRAPIEALKQSLLRSGFPPDAVERAARAVSDTAVAFAPTESTEVTVGRIARNTIRLFRDPAGLFRGVGDEGGIGHAMLYLWAWMSLAILMVTAAQMLRFRFAGVGIVDSGGAALGIVIFLSFFLIGFPFAQLFFAGLYFVAVSVFGGKTSYAAAYRILSLTGPFTTLWVLFPQPWIVLPLGAAQSVFLGVAARARCGLSTGLAAALGAVWSVMALCGFLIVLLSTSKAIHEKASEVRAESMSKNQLGDFTPYVKSADPAYKAYQSGKYGLAKDLWLASAGDLNPDTLYSLGTLYWMGQGVPRDPSEAYKWYVLAAFSGEAQARDTTLKIRAQLDSHQVRSGLGRAQHWLGMPFSESFLLRYDKHPAGAAPAGGAQHERG